MNKVPFQGKRKRLLLHGPAIETSRRKLQELRKKFNPDDVLVFEKGESIGTILASLQTVSIFDGERLVIAENTSDGFKLPATNSSTTSASLSTSPLAQEDLTNYQLQTTLVLWFDHTVDIKKWPGFEYLFFPESKEVSVFHFLDYLVAQDARAFLEAEKLKKADFDVHYFITMVFYLLRNLVATPKTAPSFVKRKLVRQRSNFSKEKLINLYRDILEIDFKLKSGLLEKDQAEFLLINKFIWPILNRVP